jgi:hypothetical protein
VHISIDALKIVEDLSKGRESCESRMELKAADERAAADEVRVKILHVTSMLKKLVDFRVVCVDCVCLVKFVVMPEAATESGALLKAIEDSEANFIIVETSYKTALFRIDSAPRVSKKSSRIALPLRAAKTIGVWPRPLSLLM